MVIGNEQIDQVCKASGLYGRYKDMLKIVCTIVKGGDFVCPGYHISRLIIYIIVEDQTLQGFMVSCRENANASMLNVEAIVSLTQAMTLKKP